MLAVLVILVPILVVAGFAVWAFYECRSQLAAETAARQSLPPVTDVAPDPVEVMLPETSRPCLGFMDGYFDRGPVILGGHGGHWGLTHHLTQFNHRPWRSPQFHFEDKPHW